MEIGSLVVCVDARGVNSTCRALVKDRIYTIRNIIVKNGATGVYLEEIINDCHPIKGFEYGYMIDRFREIDAPISISIEEVTKEDGLDSNINTLNE